MGLQVFPTRAWECWNPTPFFKRRLNRKNSSLGCENTYTLLQLSALDLSPITFEKLVVYLKVVCGVSISSDLFFLSRLGKNHGEELRGKEVYLTKHALDPHRQVLDESLRPGRSRLSVLYLLPVTHRDLSGHAHRLLSSKLSLGVEQPFSLLGKKFDWHDTCNHWSSKVQRPVW